MPAIDIPDPLPPAITPPRMSLGPRATVRSGRLQGDTCSRTCLDVPR